MLLLFLLISFHQHDFANFVNLNAIARGLLTIANLAYTNASILKVNSLKFHMMTSFHVIYKEILGHQKMAH